LRGARLERLGVLIENRLGFRLADLRGRVAETALAAYMLVDRDLILFGLEFLKIVNLDHAAGGDALSENASLAGRGRGAGAALAVDALDELGYQTLEGRDIEAAALEICAGAAPLRVCPRRCRIA